MKYLLTVLLLALSACACNNPKYDVQGYDPALFRALPKYVYRLENGPNASLGTGFAIKVGNRTFIVSNAHVCAGPVGLPNIMLTQNQREGIELRAPIVLVDWANDLCFLGAPYYRAEDGTPTRANIPAIPVELGADNPDGRKLGSTYITSGHALGGSIMWQAFVDMGNEVIPLVREDAFCEVVMKQDNVSTKTREGCTMQYDDILLSEACLPGQSGSPVVNKLGQLVGVVQATDLVENRCYAVDVYHVTDDLKLILSGALDQ